MVYFLEHVAKYLFDHFAGNTGQVCIVLPNRRAGLFLKKYLSQLIDKPIFAPSIYSIEDFVYHLSGYRKIEPAFLLFEYYEVYRQIEKEDVRPFKEFVKWAEVVIRDFNDVDLALADANKLFGYLSESKAISVWNLDEKPLTSFETRYLQFYNSLALHYKLLKEKLESGKIAYQGMAYRTLSENLEGKENSGGWNKILFAGFNALTAAEEKIIKYFLESGQAELLWDADPYYLDNPMQEAGMFLRQNKAAFRIGSLEWSEEHFKNSQKKITLVGVPKVAGQAKVAGDLLSKIQETNPELDRTSVVLNDEKLLSPLLNSIPQSIKAFNLTMGLPLRNTTLFGLITALIQLNENATRFDRTEGKNPRFYFKDLLRVINHPYFSELVSKDTDQSGTPFGQINSSNQTFYDHRETVDLFQHLDRGRKEDMDLLFKPWGNSASNAIDSLIFLLKKLKFVFSADNSEFKKIDVEYIFHFSALFNKLKSYVEKYTFLSDLESFRQLFNQMVRSLTIPFYGEPLRGVQIMGMLETRNLDFENVIMLSVNEDFIPGGTSGNSFIPFEIRLDFNLPTHRERNAVAAYHFYRLLQRAKNVYLVYNTEPGDLGGGDRSRFITQIEHELRQYNPKIVIESQVLTLNTEPQLTDESIQIQKTPDLIKKLKKRAQKGFSASSLNAYRNCSLQFYFRNILELSETDEVEETIEANTLGTVVHDTLYNLYRPYINQPLTEDGLDSSKKLVEGMVREAFQKHYAQGDIRYGKNLLIAKVAESFVSRFLRTEKKWIHDNKAFNQEVRIQELEVKMETVLSVEAPGIAPLRLKGFVDRVDRLGTVLRIIDYKTGRVEANQLKLKDWDDLLVPGKHDKVFQLLFYGFLQLNQGNDADVPEVGIFSFRNLGPGLLKPVLPGGDDMKQALPHFKGVLSSIFEELYDENVPFQQVEDTKVCEYCTYKAICAR